jgi:hypothetical protein
MARNLGKLEKNREGKGHLTKPDLEDDVDVLFTLPLADFIDARKTLAIRLKQAGHGAEADRVKTLVKPSISAWAVNQLYWKHRQAFDRLIATGQRFRQAQTSLFAGKAVDMRAPLEARREALSDLTRVATALLRDAGHNPSPETTQRISTTLEAISAYASLPDPLHLGRLTHDVDPPGFESLASLIPGGGMKAPAKISAPAKAPAPVTPSKKSVTANTRPKAAPAGDLRGLEKIRQAKVAAAKASLEDARRVLIKARATAHSTEAAHKKANADTKLKEKHRRDAEERFNRASAASEDAVRRALIAGAEVEEAAKAVEDAEDVFERASKEFESVSPTR